MLKGLNPVLSKNPTNEQLEDHIKLVTSFKDDDLIAKTIIITCMDNDLAKVFED